MKLPSGWVFLPKYEKGALDKLTIEKHDIVLCRDCRYYEEEIAQLTVRHLCNLWGDGGNATRPDGWCFLAAERKEGQA